MDLYLIRHADALAQNGTDIRSDEERPLSDLGLKQAASLGSALRRRKTAFETIFSSPLVRARQTAVQIRTVLDMAESQVEVREELAPGGRPKRLARCLNGLPASSVALVGHQPDLSAFCGWLLGDKTLRIEFAKAGAALVHVDGPIVKGSGTLLWLITPDWLGDG